MLLLAALVAPSSWQERLTHADTEYCFCRLPVLHGVYGVLARNGSSS